MVASPTSSGPGRMVLKLTQGGWWQQRGGGGLLWYRGSIVGMGQACRMTNGPSGRKAVESEEKHPAEPCMLRNG